MKPELKDKLAVFKPDTNLDEAQGKKLGAQLSSSATTLKNLDVKAVLFSMANVESYDLGGVVAIADALAILQDVLEVETGFIDYDERLFKILKPQLAETSVGLYKNFEVAKVLLDSKKHHRYTDVILWDENKMLTELVSGELKSKGYSVIAANSKEDFENKKSHKGHESILITNIYMDILNNFIPTSIQNGAVVYELQKKLDKKLQLNFNFSAFQRRLADGFKLFVFDTKSVTSVNPSIFDFFISLSLLSVKVDGVIILANLDKKFLPKIIQAKLEKAGILLYENIASIWSDYNLNKYRKANVASKGLTKKHVAALPFLVDAALETFESLTGLKATKRSHKLSPCIVDHKDRLVAAAISFEGEISGNLIVIFNEQIARKLAEMLLGDDSCSFEELLDVASEFANIIGGKSKALLAEKDQHITIAIPKTFDSLQKLATFLEDKNGVQIELEIDGDPMVLFLTY